MGCSADIHMKLTVNDIQTRIETMIQHELGHFHTIVENMITDALNDVSNEIEQSINILREELQSEIAEVEDLIE